MLKASTPKTALGADISESVLWETLPGSLARYCLVFASLVISLNCSRVKVVFVHGWHLYSHTSLEKKMQFSKSMRKYPWWFERK